MINRRHGFLLGIILFSLGICPVPDACAQSNFDLLINDSKKYDDVVVEKVISTDSFVIENYLKRGEEITLIGLKGLTPPKLENTGESDEYGFPIKKVSSPETSLEEEAMDYVKKLLVGKHIRLEFDTVKTDDHQNTLAYAYLIDGDIFVNTEILKHGYANLQLDPLNSKHTDQLRNAYQAARKEKRGIHNN